MITTDRRLWSVGCAVALSLCPAAAVAAAPSYDSAVRTVLKTHCVACHSRRDPSGDLDLSSYESVLEGSPLGEVIEPGYADDSYLYLVTAHVEEPIMPPGGERIPDADLEILRQWIDSGAPETDADVPADSPNESVAVAAETAATDIEENESTGAAMEAANPSPVIALAASAVGDRFAIGDGPRVLVYDASTLTPGGVLPFPEGEVQTLRFSADGTRVIAGGGVHGESGAVVVWSLDPPERIGVTGADEMDVVLAADLSPDGRLAVLGGPDRLVKIISTATGEPRHTLDKHTDWVLDAAFSPEGLLVATSDRDGGVCVWETEGGACLHSLRGHKDAVGRLLWRDGGDTLVTASEDGTVRVWDMHTGKQVAQWQAHDEGVLGFDGVPDESQTAASFSIGRDQRLRAWSATGAAIGEPIELGALPTSLVALPRGGALIGSFDGSVALHSVGAGFANVSAVARPEADAGAAMAALVSSSRLTLFQADEPSVDEEPPTVATAEITSAPTGVAAVAARTEERLLRLGKVLPALTQRAAELRSEAVGLESRLGEIEAELRAIELEVTEVLAPTSRGSFD